MSEGRRHVIGRKKRLFVIAHLTFLICHLCFGTEVPRDAESERERSDRLPRAYLVDRCLEGPIGRFAPALIHSQAGLRH